MPENYRDAAIQEYINRSKEAEVKKKPAEPEDFSPNKAQTGFEKTMENMGFKVVMILTDIEDK